MRGARALLIALTALIALAVPAQAELAQDGDLRVAFQGALAPSTLPRSTPAPVAVSVAGDIKVLAGAPLPQLRTITVAINRAGHLYDKGLPTCKVKSIQPATEAEARAQCPEAIVGSGHVTVQAHIPNQPFFSVDAKLLAFNGPRRNGHKLILAQVYSTAPPGAFVLTFTVKKAPGVFGTTMSTTLPKSAQGWAYLSHFDMTLKRTYHYKGRQRSYVSAACAAPQGFSSAPFPFARATYGFDNGQKLSTTVNKSCKVSGA